MTKIFRIILILGLLGYFAISSRDFQIPKAYAQEIHLTSCGTLSQANSTYILDNDVTSGGTCFLISRDGIKLDLGGHTITYNTASSATRVHGIGIVTGAVSPIVIANGSIVQGEGSSTYSDAIYDSNGGGSNIEITGITTTVSGNSSHAIEIYWGQGGFNIHHNRFISNISEIINRYAYDGYAIHIAANKGPVAASITDNVIVGGHGGIAADGPDVTIARNDISHRALGGNGFGILVSGLTDGKIHDNNIHTIQGTGILLDTVFNNVEIYSNTINVQMAPAGDQGPNAWGIKIRTYPGGGGHNIFVHDNVITSTTGPGLLPASGIGIYSSDTNVNAQYYNNNITATILPGGSYASAIKVTGAAADNTETLVYNNTIASDGYNIWFSTEDGIGANGTIFTSNTLVKGNNPTNYHTIREGFWYWATTGHIFLDTRLGNGASLTDVYPGGNADPPPIYSFYVKWFLNVKVKDTSGQPVASSTINAKDKNGNIEATAITDGQGNAQLALTQYFQTGQAQVGIIPPPTINYYTPHTITVNKDGKTNSTTVTMDASKEIILILGEGVSISKQVDKTSAVTGDILTYTISYQNTGTQEAFSAILEDPIPLGTTLIPDSVTIGGSCDNTKCTWNLGNLAAGASGSVQFQVRISP